MRGPPQRFKRECPVLWRAQVLAASNGSGWSIQDTEHCRRWKRDLNVRGQGWEGGDVAGTLSQASSTHPHNQTHTHTHTYTHQDDAAHQAFSTWTSLEEDSIC